MRRFFKKIMFGGLFPHPNTTDDEVQTPQEQRPSDSPSPRRRNIPSPTRLPCDLTSQQQNNPGSKSCFSYDQPGSEIDGKPVESRSPERTRRAAAEDFPPFLTTMDAAGRPRFVMEKVRSEGRLVIFMAESRERRRRVVRTPSVDKEAITRLVFPKD